MMWIVSFFSSWLCVLYFCVFIVFAVLSWIICFRGSAKIMFCECNKIRYLLRVLLLVFFVAVGMFFLYASYQTLIFQHYALSEKEPA